jgi:hypothetical protein
MVILTVATPQITSAEKYRPTALRSADTRFLPEMQSRPGNFQITVAAESFRNISINPTLSRA